MPVAPTLTSHGDPPRRRDEGFTLVEVLVSMTLLVIGLFAMLNLVDTGNATTAKNLKRDAANGLLREVSERTQALTYDQMVSPTAADTLRTRMTTPGTTTAAVAGNPNQFTVTRAGTTFLVGMTQATTTSTTCGTVEASQGTILILGPGACGYPANGQPVYHGPTGEASGCKVGIEQSPDDLSSGAVGLRIFLLGTMTSVCTASLLGQATANAVCTLVGQSATLAGLLDTLAGRDGLLSILGQGSLGVAVDLCKRSGTPGYVSNPPVIDLSNASTRGPETGETRTRLTVSWVSAKNASGGDVRTQIQQSSVIRRSTVAGES